MQLKVGQLMGILSQCPDDALLIDGETTAFKAVWHNEKTNRVLLDIGEAPIAPHPDWRHLTPLSRVYTMRDYAEGEISREDSGLTLQGALAMTDWSDAEYDLIAGLRVGEHYQQPSETQSGIYIRRDR